MSAGRRDAEFTTENRKTGPAGHQAFPGACLPASRAFLPFGQRSLSACAVKKGALSCGCKSHTANAPAGSNRSRRGGNDAQPLHRGSGGSTYTKESVRNTGSPTAWSGMTNQTPARDRPGAVGWHVRSAVEAG
jgi:hypothetical protein